MNMDNQPLSSYEYTGIHLSPIIQDNGEEQFIGDDRMSCTPSELVQRKLRQLLPSAPMPVSSIHTGRTVRRYA